MLGMKKLPWILLFSFVTLFCCARVVPAQETPFLSQDEIRMFINEISGDRAYEHVRWLSHWARERGSDGYFEAADYLVKAAKEAGLEDVKFIEQPARGSGGAYNARSAELWMIEPVEVKLADIGSHVLYLAINSYDADVTAELVWVGDGSEEALEGLDVAGKMVLTSGQPGAAARNAVWKKGALGVVSYPINNGKSRLDHPDQIARASIPRPSEDQKGTFAFVLSSRAGETLRHILEMDGEQDLFRTGTKTKGGRIVVKAQVDTDFTEEPARTGFVEGWIRGSKFHDQQIVLTSHIQEEATSSNDDASGMGNMLEMARVYTKLIREGKMKRPLRDIRFWWADEIYSEYRFLSDHPGEREVMLANINQDMVGAKQSIGDRIQRLIYNPHSRTSYLDTLLESIGTYVIQTNTYYLSAHRGQPWPTGNKKAIYSTQGTREGFHAMLVPYFDSSDHRVFVEGIIGVPAVSLINMDDELIHSSDDDLFNVDPTQMARNNFIVSALSFILASSEDDVQLFAGETYAHGCRRLGNDLAVATRLLDEGAQDGGKDAHIVVEQGIEREARALESIRVFAAGDAKAGKSIDSYLERLQSKKGEMAVVLNETYQNLHGKALGKIDMTATEAAADKKVPANIDSVDAYFTKRNEVDFSGEIWRHMSDEVYNFVDGERSYYDIYKAVRAESLAHGEWYYGPVSLEDVVGLLDATVEAGAITLKAGASN